MAMLRLNLYKELTLHASRPLLATLVLTASVFAQQATTAPAEAEKAADALRSYNAAVEAADVVAIEKAMYLTNDMQKQAVTIMGDLASATNDLYRATIEKFGEPELEKAGVSKESFPPVFPTLPLEQLKINVEGDRATLALESGQPLPLTLIKIEGAWKLNAGDILPPFSEQELKQQSELVRAGLEAIRQTKVDLASPVLRSPDEVVVLMQHRIQRAFQAAQLEQIEQATTEPSTRPAGPAVPGN